MLTIKKNVTRHTNYKISSRTYLSNEERRNKGIYNILEFYTEKNSNPLIIDFKKKISNFKFLQSNWDSYGAEIISNDSILLAIQILDFLEANDIIIDFVFPMRDGGIQLEKSTMKYDIEIEVYNTHRTYLLIFDKEANLKFEKKYNFSHASNSFITDLNLFIG